VFEFFVVEVEDVVVELTELLVDELVVKVVQVKDLPMQVELEDAVVPMEVLVVVVAS
jgi:hypothetical protein